MVASAKLFEEALTAFNGGRLAEAAEKFRRVLKLDPNHVPSLNLAAISLLHQGQHAEAEQFMVRAVALHSGSDVTFYNYGLILKRLNKPEQSLVQFDKALRLNPNVADTWLNRGTVLNDLKRHQEAVADFNRAISLNPACAEAMSNKGNSLNGLRRHGQAIESYDQALSINPNLADAWLGRAVALADLGDYAQALVATEAALKRKPRMEEAWVCRGNAYFKLKRYDEACEAYGNALTIKPDLEFVDGLICFAKLWICDWSDIDDRSARLIAAVRKGERRANPFEFLTISPSPKDQLDAALIWNERASTVGHASSRQNDGHERIRVGYVSSDFRTHPIGQLTAGLFECHDRSRFEITGVSIGSDDRSDLRARLKDSFDNFLDGTALSDSELAAKIEALGIDILVDLNGITSGARTPIFAHRPAPIQVNYLGYPGTMGAMFMDYIIGDPVVIPDQHREFYAERVVRLPHSYQANDFKKDIPSGTPTRSEASLPESGIVFCCFNNSYKILPDVFACWMRILRAVDGSVLWLLDENDRASENLRAEARARGVDAHRIVFAPRVPLGEHLARHRLADIFLDTLPYNAHTTASDALWTGLPVLTRIGDAFAGRVAASLLNAVGLPELVTHSSPDYESLAIELARDRSKLDVLKGRLRANRLSTPLFDTKRFTGHIEAAYDIMHRRYRDGLAPDHFDVAG